MDFIYWYWGDLASLLGLALTIWFAWRAKTASEQARDAARAAQRRIFTFDSIADLSAALSTMQEILRLHKLEAWDAILDRCAALQLELTRCEHAPGLPEVNRTSIKTAAAQFRIIMDGIEKIRTDQQPGEFDSVLFNRTVLNQMAVLETARTILRKTGVQDGISAEN